MGQKIAIIGSGFSSLAAASYLAQGGHEVTIYEKNSTVGGRARQLKKDGFVFDIGPTWYWMPDVFERFFGDFGKKPLDYYELIKLGPAYSVYFGENDFITIEDTLEKICAAFEAEEPGSSIQLKKFIAEAQNNYEIAIKDLVYRPGVSPLELVTPVTMKKLGSFSAPSVNRSEKSLRIRAWYPSSNFLYCFWVQNLQIHRLSIVL